MWVQRLVTESRGIKGPREIDNTQLAILLARGNVVNSAICHVQRQQILHILHCFSAFPVFCLSYVITFSCAGPIELAQY